MSPRRPPTRAQQTVATLAGVLALLLAAAAWWGGAAIASWLSGDGLAPPKLEVLPEGLLGDAGLLAVTRTPTSTPLWVGVAAVIAVVGLRLLIVPLVLLTRRDPRAAGLASSRRLRRVLSEHAVRRAARFTRPDLSWARRRVPFLRVPLTELGYHLGCLRGADHQLWASFELRVRVIARTGWGKTARILVKIVRGVPGAALVGTTKPDLFEQTVRAREARGPVYVIDFSDADHRFAAGFTRLTWDLIAGCTDLQLALRRAGGLVAGAEDGDRNDDTDGFFRDAAMHVIAGWLHAAALARLTMDDVIKWQRNIGLSQPLDILNAHGAAEDAAALSIIKHLDERAERTTSGVERFLANALYPFGTRDGREFAVTSTGVKVPDLIASHATVYLLASPTTAASVSPLLTLFADEWVHTCRAVALSRPGRRLARPAVAVLDELRGLVPIPSLPQVAYEMRSYGVGLVYGLQNVAQEDELYGPAAESLAQNVQVTIVGGYDASIADQLVDQAAEVPIPQVSTSGHWWDVPDRSESTTYRKAVEAADQQELEDGHSLVRLVGAPLFYAWSPSYRDDRRLRRRISAEERSVRAQVDVAQARDSAERANRLQKAQAEYDRAIR